jgi:hypothetical protein
MGFKSGHLVSNTTGGRVILAPHGLIYMFKSKNKMMTEKEAKVKEKQNANRDKRHKGVAKSK